MKIFITPRLNFHFNFFDLLIGITGIFFDKEKMTRNKINCIFPDNKGLIFINHARSGIKLVIESLNLNKGSKIGVLIYNCHTVFSAVKNAGYSPVFIDIDNDYRLSIDDLKNKAELIDALVVTHLFGIPAPMDKIIEIMGSKPVIEDCAHSFMVKYNQQITGTFGFAGVFSFGQSKFPPAGEGGFTVFNNESVFKKAVERKKQLPKESDIKNIVQIVKAFISGILLSKIIYGPITSRLKKSLDSKIDYNNKFEFKETQVNKGFLAILNKRLNNSEKYFRLQNKNVDYLIKYLAQKREIRCNYRPFFMIPLSSGDVENELENSIKNGVELGQHFKHSIDWAKNIGYNGNCPNAERILSNTITIPCHYNLKINDLKKYINSLNKSMNIIFDILHPAHINLFKKSIIDLKKQGHNVYVLCIKRGKLPLIVEKELEDIHVNYIGNHQCTKWSIIFDANIIRFFKILIFVFTHKIDVGISFGSFLLGLALKLKFVPNIHLSDDPERKVNEKLELLTCNERYLPPIVESAGKTGVFNALKEWAYLSPKYFKANRRVLDEYKLLPKSYIFIREISTGTLNYSNQNESFVSTFGNLISKDYKVILSLENKKNIYLYPKDWILLEEPVSDIHSLIYFSKLVISSGDSMAREGAMLGVPSIYCGNRQMKANLILQNMNMLFHIQENVSVFVNKTLEDERYISHQDVFREHLLNEWVDVNELIINLIGKYK